MRKKFGARQKGRHCKGDIRDVKLLFNGRPNKRHCTRSGILHMMGGVCRGGLLSDWKKNQFTVLGGTHKQSEGLQGMERNSVRGQSVRN